MNTHVKQFMIGYVVTGLLLLSCVSPARANREEFDFRRAVPDKKAALPVSLRRNPFQISGDREQPLPVLKDKNDPAAKLPVLLVPHIRSVVHQPRPLLLVDGAVLQPGDELHLVKNDTFEKFRIVLREIGSDRLVFHLTALDPQLGGQVECTIPLSGEMRRGK